MDKIIIELDFEEFKFIIHEFEKGVNFMNNYLVKGWITGTKKVFREKLPVCESILYKLKEVERVMLCQQSRYDTI